MASIVSHEFYCIHCGNKGIPLPRKLGQFREKGHYKNIYCINCKNTTRHTELYSELDVNRFKEDFKKGVYIEDAKNDNFTCRSSWVWENNLR